jgi:hypothetical protein
MSLFLCHWHLALGYPHGNPMSSLTCYPLFHPLSAQLPPTLALSPSLVTSLPSSLDASFQIHILRYHLILNICILHQLEPSRYPLILSFYLSRYPLILSFHPSVSYLSLVRLLVPYPDLPACTYLGSSACISSLASYHCTYLQLSCQFILDQHLAHIAQLLVSYSNASFS